MGYDRGVGRFIYDHAPSGVRTLIASAYGWQQRRERYGRGFLDALERIQRHERDNNEAHAARAFEMVRQFVDRACTSSPYWTERLRALGYRAGDLRTPADLSALPVLTKEEVRQHMVEIRARDAGAMRPRWVHTSGTTGKALQFPIAGACFEREYAYRAAHYAWGGIDLVARPRLALAYGHPVVPTDQDTQPYWVRDLANNWLILSSYHLSDANLPTYASAIESFNPVMIGGYPSSVYLLALAYQRHGAGTLRLRSVFTASETLLDKQRCVIEEAFGVKALMWYGNTENCANIVECEQGRYHGRWDHSWMEVLGPSGTPADEGSLICTAFGNPAFPLIRYEVGDVVRRSSETACPCGRAGLMFDRVVGRIEDYIVTPTGRLIGRLDHIFKDAVNVSEAQLVQDAVERIQIRIVRRPGYSEADERSIEHEARVRLGREIGLEFQYVDALPRTAAGKLRFIVSSLRQARLPGSDVE